MSKETKDFRIEVIDRLARIEEQLHSVSDTCGDTNKHVDKMNSEMGDLEKRMGKLEVRQSEAEQAYKRANFYWKIAAIFLSPTITAIVIAVLHAMIGF